MDPGGRGRTPVERYQAAAEKYGYIVAGSKNSRNGSWQASTDAVAAMTKDVAARFTVDAKRVLALAAHNIQIYDRIDATKIGQFPEVDVNFTKKVIPKIPHASPGKCPKAAPSFNLRFR